jgi:hypothetical protein
MINKSHNILPPYLENKSIIYETETSLLTKPCTTTHFSLAEEIVGVG